MLSRIVALLIVVAALCIAVGLTWFGPTPSSSRRTSSVFLEHLALEPIVAGALPNVVDVGRSSVSGGRNDVRFWKRTFDDASWTFTAPLTADQSAPFLRAVRDSVERRLEAVDATIRGVDMANWPESTSTHVEAPVTLTIPYATRRRVGWVTIHAVRARDDAFTMWLGVHEGPRPD